MHYSYDNKEYRPYKLSEYTDALASAHSVLESIGDEFTLENLQTKYDEIMSMNVTPSTKTTLLDVTFDSDGNQYDASGQLCGGYRFHHFLPILSEPEQFWRQLRRFFRRIKNT